MPEARIKFVNVEANKFNEEQTQIVVGFDIGGEAVYMRYTVAGGTEGQQKFASMQLSKLLKMAGPYKVRTEQDDRGKTQVYADDGYRGGGQSADPFRGNSVDTSGF